MRLIRKGGGRSCEGRGKKGKAAAGKESGGPELNPAAGLNKAALTSNNNRKGGRKR